MNLGSYFTEVEETQQEGSSRWDYFTPSDPPNLQAASAAQSAPCARFFSEDHVFWAMRNLPIREAVKHFLVCGAIGSGKTTTIELFLQSIKERFKKGRKQPEQLIVFDAKGDIIPLLAAYGFDPSDQSSSSNFWIINPYDTRSAVWNISEAVQSPMMARHFASLVVPEEPQSTAPFFWRSSRRLIYAAILALNQIARDWDLRTLICALSSAERISALAAQHPRAKEITSSVMKDTQHCHAVISSLGTYLDNFEQVAALWHNPSNARNLRTFSIKEFLAKPGVLVLGNDPVLRESLWPINATILKALCKEILRRPNVDSPRHWFVLDEFTAMEKVEGIHELVNRGRSKGASVLVGLQGIDKLNALYEKTGANDLLEQLTSKTFLRAGGAETAEWIERFFGRFRAMEAVYSESSSQSGSSQSVQYQMSERSLFIASFFMNLPFTGPGQAYVAVSDVPAFGMTLITRRWFDVINSWRIRPEIDPATGETKVPSVIPRDNPAEQTLEAWDELEEQCFCGAAPEIEAPRDSKRKKSGMTLPTRKQRYGREKRKE